MELAARILVFTILFLIMQYVGYLRGRSSIKKKMLDETIGTLYIDYDGDEPDIYIHLFEHPSELADNEIVKVHIRKREKLSDSQE